MVAHTTFVKVHPDAYGTFMYFIYRLLILGLVLLLRRCIFL